jgi:nitric oxide reductase NorD protein
MTMVDLKERFFELITPPLPNEWEVEENLEKLRPLAPHRQELVLRQIPAIWPVSNSLCYSYLASAGPALECLADQQINDWVSAILDTYEQQGLRAAQHFMADAETNYLCRLRGEAGVELAALPHLQTYAQGVTGQPVRLAPGPEPGTDTETIFLPAKIARFATPEENFLYYKLLLTLQAGLLQIGTYQWEVGRADPLVLAVRATYPTPGTPPALLNLNDFFQLFPNPRRAEDLFTLVEAQRLLVWLAATFPGLWRDGQPLLQQLAEAEADHLPGALNDRMAQLRGLVMGTPASTDRVEAGKTGPSRPAWFPAATSRVEETAARTAALYAQFANSTQPDQAMVPLPWLGRLLPQAAWQVRMRERQQAKDKFIQGLALLLANAPPPTESAPAEPVPPPKGSNDQSATAALVLAPDQKSLEAPEPQTSSPSQNLVTLETLAEELPESLQELGREIIKDLGGIPAEYVSAAQGLAGHGPLALTASPDTSGESLAQPLTYAEWDFRRQGYRRDWCAVHEKILQPVKSSLIETTLAKYRGQVLQLRKQFELLRAGERFVRRQPDGNDFDLDAVIEALSDRRAGRAGSEQLFIRLRRDQRDIAVYFLVDMSSSTEGWINLALKEALILTGTALENLGDRFAIAGFSGMRRTRCDFYRVKDFAEPYNAEVKSRICAIAPREYTRMGPALRHATTLLQKVEARTRLLFVLSDGKPEDYDDYKGKYAIEDTRRALIEAKAVGIHPFCLTIDRQAHDYMAHMYGEVNYIFLDDVRQLPLRMPAIYRNLTT